MAFFSQILVDPALPLPPPAGAEKVTLRYQTRKGMTMESAPLYSAAAYRRAKDLLAAGYTVWYKDVLTFTGV